MAQWKWLEEIFPSDTYIFTIHHGEVGRLFSTPEELEVLDWLEAHISQKAQ